MPFKMLWALWGIIVFMISVSILTPIYLVLILIFGRKIRYSLVAVNYDYLTPFLLFMTGIWVKKINREKMPDKGAHVYISNHRSMLDIIVNAQANKQAAFFLAKKSITKFPVFGTMVKALGILVDRKDIASRRKSYDNMRNTLLEGYSLFIYPEGTRNRTDNPVNAFYDGAFRAAIEAQVPVISQTLVFITDRYSPEHPLLLSPGKVEVHFDGPFPTAGLTVKDLAAFKEMIRARMADTYTKALAGG
jgi:1-acyl-sn-glycerol-3-phosphate acyltransferase